MHELYELKTKLCDELEKYAKKDLTASNLEYVDKLAHAAKNLDKLINEGDYSERRGGYARTDYARNMGGSYADRGGSYAKRDSMGRYSSASLVDELRELRHNAPDERTRMEFDRFIQKMESM